MNIVELERILWATTDKIRTNMDAAEGSIYVLLAHEII